MTIGLMDNILPRVCLRPTHLFLRRRGCRASVPPFGSTSAEALPRLHFRSPGVETNWYSRRLVSDRIPGRVEAAWILQPHQSTTTVTSSATELKRSIPLPLWPKLLCRLCSILPTRGISRLGLPGSWVLCEYTSTLVGRLCLAKLTHTTFRGSSHSSIDAMQSQTYWQIT